MLFPSTRVLYDKFNLGLGVNTMQGREAKHVCLSAFAKHATLSNRWISVMRHEFVSTAFIRKADPAGFRYKKSKDKYIPDINKPSI